MAARLAIVGTVTLAHPGERAAVLRRALRAIDTLAPEVVISGGARGVDRIGMDAAARRGYREPDTLIVHRATVRRWQGYGGFENRNRLIVDDCTHLLRIYCDSARTYGSGWTADLASRLGRIVVRHCICQDVQREPDDSPHA